MAVVTTDLLDATTTNFRALFESDFDAAMGTQGWQNIASEMSSTGLKNTYTWLGTTPNMVDATRDPVPLSSLPEYDFTITNKVWKAAIEVDRSTLEDDSLNLVMPRINQLGMEAARHPGELIYGALNNATTATTGDAYDGVTFFNDTRTIGASANIDNILGGTAFTAAGIATDLGLAAGQMAQFQDEHGRPINVYPDTIVCHASALQIMWQALLGPGAQNTAAIPPQSANGVFSANGYTIIATPYSISSDNQDYYALYTGGSARPFIFQNRLRPGIEALATPTTSEAVLQEKYVWAARARYEVGYGEPRHAVMIDQSA